MGLANRDLILAGTGAAGASGCELLWVAPTGTAAPTATAATNPLAAGWASLGLISDDGITLGISESNEKVMAYGTGVPVRTIPKTSEQTFDVTCLESNEEVLEVFNRLDIGDIVVDVDGDFSFSTGEINIQQYSFVVDIMDGVNFIRVYYPIADVTDRKERKVGSGKPLLYTFTVTAYPLNGVAATEFYRIPGLAGNS
jgi:hypothetical protein